MDRELFMAPEKETKSFKPYLSGKTNLGKEIYERLVGAFAKMEPQDRPWCGIGITVDLVAVAPKGVTIAVIKELGRRKNNRIHVPRNWREPWYMETVDRQKHIIESNPCEQGEQAIATMRRSIGTFLKTDDRPTFPCIKCLILFPDECDFEGPKEFSILDGDEVVILSLRNLRDLPEAILMATERERLDSRVYRKWIQSSVRNSSDDSILGTWLDPAFEEAAPAPPKARLWRVNRSLHHKALAKDNELSSQTRSVRTQRVLKLIVMITAGMSMAMIGWGLYFRDLIEPMPQGLSLDGSGVPPQPAMPTTGGGFIDVPMPHAGSLLPEDEKGKVTPIPETVKSNELREPTLASENQLIESAKRPPGQSQASNESHLERQKMERLIRDAILLRAIKGVTVKFVDDTAYLGGQVATENQKSAAEKAARGVPGTREVRNSIEVIH